MILYTTNQDISQECRCFEYTFTNNTLPLHSENRTNHNLMLNQRHHPVITLLAVIMISVFSCQNTRIKQISDNAPILSLQLASSIHNNAVPDDEEPDTLSEVTDISALQAQNKLLRQRSHFTTGGIAMILGVGAILVFLMLNSRWNRTLEIKKPSDFKQGFSCAKFTNVHADGSAAHDSKFVDMDVPFMRAAEAWLTYAEAEKRLGHDSECKMAIDYLRNRAHKSTQPKYTLNEICDEWAREFYYEGRRRMDLIRFGKFGGDSDYTWEWKGGSKDGGSIEASRNVYGIPTKECVANSNIKQNPGYGD